MIRKNILLNYIRTMFKINNVLGKVLIISIIMVAAHFHILSGVIAVLLFIILTSDVIEGMENNDENIEDDMDATDMGDIDMGATDMDENDMDNSESSKDIRSIFKKKYCNGNKLMTNDNEITVQQLKEFSNIKYTSGVCNPCDVDCDFEIISSNEKLTMEENLRSSDSNSYTIDREKTIAKAE